MSTTTSNECPRCGLTYPLEYETETWGTVCRFCATDVHEGGDKPAGYQEPEKNLTWNVALWISNDYGMYHEAREKADRWNTESDTRDEAVSGLAAELKDWIEETAEMTCPGVIEGASFVADLFGAALSEVDWHEIATNHIEDVTK